MTNKADHTRKVIKFNELIEILQNDNPCIINRKWINYKLLNNKTIEDGNGHEFKREIS